MTSISVSKCYSSYPFSHLAYLEMQLKICAVLIKIINCLCSDWESLAVFSERIANCEVHSFRFPRPEPEHQKQQTQCFSLTPGKGTHIACVVLAITISRQMNTQNVCLFHFWRQHARVSSSCFYHFGWCPQEMSRTEQSPREGQNETVPCRLTLIRTIALFYLMCIIIITTLASLGTYLQPQLDADTPIYVAVCTLSCLSVCPHVCACVCVCLSVRV